MWKTKRKIEKIFILIIFALLFSSCLLTLEKKDIETPIDTVRTLQWALNKISQTNFFDILDELFVDEGEKITLKLSELQKSKLEDEKKIWVKLQEIFKDLIIRPDKVNIDGKYATVKCIYYFPSNFYLVHIEVKMKKTSLGWRITGIDNLIPTTQ